MNSTEEKKEGIPPDESPIETPDGIDSVKEETPKEAPGTETEPESEKGSDKKSDKKLAKQVRQLEHENAELKKKAEQSAAASAEANDRYLRMLAEYDNYRKRTQKEKESIYADAYSDALKQILPVIDNLELAAKHAGTDAASILGGVEMTLKIAKENLAKIGIEAFGEAGENFDPNRHTAVLHIEDDSMGENTVAEVLQKGYRKDDRIIRYAVVKVAN